MDFALSGVAACGACVFTNPLEVVKTRMQLQGELQSRGSYRVHYRNVFHAFYTIGRVEGLRGLQRGLMAGMLYQFFMNGVRLGSYALIESAGYIHTGGRVSAAKSTAAGAASGVVGAVMGSPIYLAPYLFKKAFFHGRVSIQQPEQRDLDPDNTGSIPREERCVYFFFFFLPHLHRADWQRRAFGDLTPHVIGL
uniref:Solute carrier family 25 member 35 n=1 Tax=Astyanax mexicanus TaxID=7994 RepID=A0A8B9JGI2_ASTMX